jgi:hypothetical protein
MWIGGSALGIFRAFFGSGQALRQEREGRKGQRSLADYFNERPGRFPLGNKDPRLRISLNVHATAHRIILIPQEETMATIDPRLIELVDTLVAAGADWLAFEIFDGIRSGNPGEESDNPDHEMRSSLRSWKDDKSSAPGARKGEAVMKPIEGDDQIEFAASYVVDRITEAIEMTRMSLDNLNRISAKSSENRSEVAPAPLVGITLGLEGSEFRFTRDQAEQLRGLLPELRTSLLEWSVRIRQKERES